MRLAELSELSGVPIPTIKYYLREQLLPPGRRVTATQAEYDDSHLRRLRFVRALIQVGRVPVATAREVLAAVDDDSLGRTFRLGGALWALPQPPEEPADDPDIIKATAIVDQLLEELGWTTSRDVGSLSPSYRSLVATVATLNRLGYTCGTAELAPYARHMERVAEHDIDRLDTFPGEAEKVEAAVAGVILVEPVLLMLRRIAQEEHSTRRFGL
ncbi:MerR family transcriptional regulator [Streptomyces sp. NPDC046821]|uniref:MerR family transcriptional regulator n=1 Tax=Streptomyces sp. NPDC046821 TaxID=3154702 RepID=UPI0033E318DA